MRRRVWVGIALATAVAVAVPVGFVATYMVSNAVGRTTVVTADDGSSRTVYWRDYPGVAGLDPQEVLAGPTVEEALVEGEKMVAEMRAAIGAEFGLEWAGDPNDTGNFDPLHENVQNYFGGSSLLTTINAPTSQSTTVPETWADKERIIEIIAEVAAAHGFGAPVLDHERDYVTEEDRLRDFGGATPAEQVFVSGIVEGPGGQWVFFAMQDPTKDVDGSFDDRLMSGEWEPASVMLSYGANALLPEDARAEFERRLEPFRGLEQPEPLES